MAAVESANRVEEEVEELKKDIVRLGSGNAEGQYVVPFGVLFDDPKTEQFYEALVGTLKAAKKKGVINFKGQILMKGMHDKEPITLLVPPEGAATPAPASDAASAPASPAAAAAEDLSEKVGAMSVGKASPADAGAESGGAEESPNPKTLSKRSSTMSRGFEHIESLDADSQCEFFLKSFIFALGDSWKDVPALLKRFKKCAADVDDDTPPEMLNHIQASGFLQKEGKTRTANQRKAELNDVDINNDGFICFIEYLLLHYKPMILTEYYKRHDKAPVEDLSNECIGLTGVGDKLVEELLTLPKGLNPQIEAALEEFTEKKKAKEKKIAALQEKAAAGGVKGMTAKQELVILESGDDTELNRIEITLNAAKRRAATRRGSAVLEANRKAEEEEAAKAKAEAKAKMAAKMAMFGGGK